MILFEKYLLSYSDKPACKKWVFSFLAIALMGICWHCSNSHQLSLPSSIKDTYVAVLPFKNNTGDPELDVIGEMAADWITYGLHETEEGKILSAGEVSRFIETAKIQNVVPDNSMAQHAGVHYLIDGTYYKMKDSLYFSSHVKDLQSGEIVFSFPIHQGPPEDPMAIIEHLKQRILGYWVTKNRAGYERRPPIYEAYQAYLESGKVWYDQPDKATDLLKKAAELDSNFHYAIFGYIHKLISSSKEATADSMITVYQNKKEQLNRMELEFLTGLQSRLNKDYDQQWKHWNSPVMEAYWGKNFVLKQKTSLLLGYYNLPEKALELLQQVDFASLNYKEDPPSRMLYLNKIEALARLGRTAEATELWMNLPFEARNMQVIFKKLFGLAQMQRYSELKQAMAAYESTMTSLGYPAHFMRLYAILGLLATKDEVKAKSEIRSYVQFLEKENKDIRSGPGWIQMPEILTLLYLALEEPERAKPYVESISPNDSNLMRLTLVGIYHAQLNNGVAARQVIQQLKSKRGKYDYGDSEMLMAIVEAWLGNEEKALALLAEARQNGKTLWGYFFDGDWRLKPLHNHPDFTNKVLAPIPVPEINNPAASEKVASPHYWFWLFAFLLIGGAYLFIFRNQLKTNSTSPSRFSNEKAESPAEMEDEFIRKLKSVVTSNMSDADFSLPQVCRAMGFSRAQVYRKIKEQTGQSPANYIRNLKLQKAKDLLQTTNLNVSEVAYEVGFKDLSYFSRSYSEKYGKPPSETRK